MQLRRLHACSASELRNAVLLLLLLHLSESLFMAVVRGHLLRGLDLNQQVASASCVLPRPFPWAVPRVDSQVCIPISFLLLGASYHEANSRASASCFSAGLRWTSAALGTLRPNCTAPWRRDGGVSHLRCPDIFAQYCITSVRLCTFSRTLEHCRSLHLMRVVRGCTLSTASSCIFHL